MNSFYVILVIYIVVCLVNFLRCGLKIKPIKLKDGDFPSNLMVCKNKTGRIWLYRRSDGHPMPPPPRVEKNFKLLDWEERWLYQYGKREDTKNGR